MKKLQQLYPHALISSNKPNPTSDDYHVFKDAQTSTWISVPKNDLNDKEFTLLSMLYDFVEYLHNDELPPTAQAWHNFLFSDGLTPASHSGKALRFIHFQFDNEKLDRFEVESALKGFFSESTIFLWEQDNRGIMIEDNTPVSLSDKEFITMSETLEADFFAKSYFFIGKYNELTASTPAIFKQESDFFSFALTHLSTEKIFSFEKVFPSYLAQHLPDFIKNKLDAELLKIFREEPEVHLTIKAFLENNLNASLTAKHLYIHRNTLQYRIDKFTEKTGIPLKDFHSAFTVFLASLISSLE